METALLISNLVLWLAVVALGLIVFALTRQIGVLYERVAPAGALMMSKGPKVGETAPEFTLPSLTGGAVKIGGADDRRAKLLFFLSPTCPICGSLVPVLRSIVKREGAWLDVVLASDGDEETQRDFVTTKGLDEFPYVLSTELGLAYQVAKLPHAVLIDADGIVAAFGLTNSREHIESLFEAMERKVASIQDYLAQPDAEPEEEQGQQQG